MHENAFDDMMQVSSDSKRLLQKGIFVFKESTTDYDTIDSRAMELDNYERVWHQKIFSPCFNTFQEEVRMIPCCGSIN